MCRKQSLKDPFSNVRNFRQRMMMRSCVSNCQDTHQPSPIPLRISLGDHHSHLRKKTHLPLNCSDTYTCTMVLVEEVPEEVLLKEGERDSDFETDSESGSEASSIFSDDDDDDDARLDEGLYDRLVALKDILPPQTRSNLAYRWSKGKEWTWWGMVGCGSIAWWVSTSALLVGLPLALAIEDETRVVQQERESQMQSQGQQQVSEILPCSSRLHTPHLLPNSLRWGHRRQQFKHALKSRVDMC